MNLKFYIYQIIAVGIIWCGMAFFFGKMDEVSKIVFYAVTSWLLFLIVLLVKYIIRWKKGDDRQNKS
ncbi:hypothetical protein P5G51_017055 [Virgibacillus sp. 179-BFC.A HS]|uniref:Uncharacterized protein n=1 Tax=Tigheibacillus jepli TaxID=3035914 RepID=A0ABU5CKF1_9BACI|nr:hypothetical protein [Virgibacillus sp. 179-BFC.A HS]MDY0406836.1 hypothetical protein [Virgibacillus sp. 179-BFC.A HS]